MPSGVTTTFIITETLFLGTGIMIAIATVLWMKEMNSSPTIDSVARLVLISHFPMQGMPQEFYSGNHNMRVGVGIVGFVD